MKTNIWFTEMESPLGKIILAATEAGLCGVYFHDQKYLPKKREVWVRNDEMLSQARGIIEGYFEGNGAIAPGGLDLKMSLDSGTPFQQEVWQAMREIGLGVTWTYRRLAERVGRPQAVRAVGAAVGRNPLCILIPCHRVIGSSGALTGYAGGLERKRWLLRHEGQID